MCFRIFVFIVLMSLFSFTTSSLGFDHSTKPYVSSKPENITINVSSKSNLNLTGNANKTNKVSMKITQKEDDQNKTRNNLKLTKVLPKFGTSTIGKVKKNTATDGSANKNNASFAVPLDLGRDLHTQPVKTGPENNPLVKCYYVTNGGDNNNLLKEEEWKKSGRNRYEITDHPIRGASRGNGMYWENDYYERYWPQVNKEGYRVEGLLSQGFKNLLPGVRNWPDNAETLPPLVNPESIRNVYPEVQHWPNIVKPLPQLGRPESVGNQDGHNWPNVVETLPPLLSPENIRNVYPEVHNRPNNGKTLPQLGRPDSVGNPGGNNWPNVVETLPPQVSPENIRNVYPDVHNRPNIVNTLPQMQQGVNQMPPIKRVRAHEEQRKSYNEGSLQNTGNKWYRFQIWLPLESSSTNGFFNDYKFRSTSEGWVRDIRDPAPSREGFKQVTWVWDKVGKRWLPEQHNNPQIVGPKIGSPDIVQQLQPEQTGFEITKEVGVDDVRQQSHQNMCCSQVTTTCVCPEPNENQPNWQQALQGGGRYPFQRNAREERPVQRYPQIEEIGSTRGRPQQEEEKLGEPMTFDPQRVILPNQVDWQKEGRPIYQQVPIATKGIKIATVYE